MFATALDKSKGKTTIHELPEEDHSSEESSSSSSESSSDSDSDSSDIDEEITPEYLESLLEKARQNASKAAPTSTGEEEVITLQSDDLESLPKLDPGALPAPYFTFDKSRNAGPSSIRDAEIEKIQQSASALSVPAPPIPPEELTKSGKPLTKKEKKALKTQTAGSDWFDLPAPSEADLPRMYREYEALRLRNQLDPKRFYRKEEGEGKGIKGLPKYFAIGTIVATKTPFGGPTAENLAKSERKRTFVDELVDDAEAKSYAKKKFKDLQTVRGAKGKGTLAAKQALRKPKW